MHYLVFATDYDGTLAKDGKVPQETLDALERLKASGRKLLLITGRILEDLRSVFPQLTLFDTIVAENGAVLYNPAESTERLLGKQPDQHFLQALQERGVPFGQGKVIVATSRPHEQQVLEIIQEQGLELQIIFNKGAVMILPTGINKGSGLFAALQDLHLSAHNVVGIGDAENDHSFLSLCECSVAVANALPSLKETADYTTHNERGAGVAEIIEQILQNDLADLDHAIQQQGHHLLTVGYQANGEAVTISARRNNILICGPSGGGKSLLARSLLEQIATQQYQLCLIDPEGDYEQFSHALVLGNPQKAPTKEEIAQVLEKSEQGLVLNLLAIPLEDRPTAVRDMLPHLQEQQTRTGHPHWLAFDEAHHLFPPEWDTSPLGRVRDLFNLLFITSHPENLAKDVLRLIDVLIVVGPDALATLQQFSQAIEQPLPEQTAQDAEANELLIWPIRSHQAIVKAKPLAPQGEHQRHKRKYAQGNLGEDISFYFRGPEQKLNLRANNLIVFNQLAQGVDDETWRYHLERGDYANWFQAIIKDEDLANEAKQVQKDRQLSPAESRAHIKAAIEQRYTLPS